jgi:hypothetical protein
VAARGKLSQTVAQLEKVLKAQRALYSQANAPVAALKQAEAAMRQIRTQAAEALAPETTQAQQQVARWAEAANAWRTNLSQQIQHLASQVERGYSTLKSLEANAGRTQRQQPRQGGLPELGQPTQKQPEQLTSPGVRPNVHHTQGGGAVTGAPAQELEQAYRAKVRQAADWVLEQKRLFPLAKTEDLIEQAAHLFNLSNVADVARAVQARANEVLGDAASGVRASAGGGTADPSSDATALQKAIELLSDPETADSETQEAQKLAARLLPSGASPQLLQRLTQEILAYAKSKAKKQQPKGDVLEVLAEIGLGLSSSESNHPHKQAVVQMLKKLLDEANFSSRPNAAEYQLVRQLLQEKWGWTQPPQALLDKLVKRLNDLVNEKHKAPLDQLIDMVPFTLTDLLKERGNGSPKGIYMYEAIERHLRQERSPLLDADGNPTFVAVDMLRRELIGRIIGLFITGKNTVLKDPKQQEAFQKLLDHIHMFSDQYTLNVPAQRDASGYPHDTVLQGYGSSKVLTDLVNLSRLLADIKDKYPRNGHLGKLAGINPLELTRLPEIQTWMERVAKEWMKYVEDNIIPYDLGSVKQWELPRLHGNRGRGTLAP